MTKLRFVFALAPEAVTFVAAEDSGIKSLADVKGKIINLGDPGSGNRINALQVFKEVGLEPGKDFRGEGLKPADAPHTLQDGRIDGFFYTLGHPNGNIKEANGRQAQVPHRAHHRHGQPAQGSAPTTPRPSLT